MNLTKKMKRYKIYLTPEARNDLKEARAWYRKKNPSLPKRFMQQVKITLDNLSTLPTTHTVRYKEVRFAQVAVFPYAIHYLVEDGDINIIAVRHTAINPEKWTDRL